MIVLGRNRSPLTKKPVMTRGTVLNTRIKDATELGCSSVNKQCAFVNDGFSNERESQVRVAALRRRPVETHAGVGLAGWIEPQPELAAHRLA